ncbi:NADH dehydrogenase subunit E [Rhizobium wenxiniae]|uniref:NADH-quinone oxidoreductase subunit E n=1 Tax=Rhizobium wenxiniae TaxID=1737357 RepID=A0A7W9Y4L9_9HYPH|nr:NADH-quinone oxidoreductase subunit E [Rhizobium wenxiniae]MBB6161895.1 NADH-quinone oxidoreductase subunit E [Rhizobium wenxiniae]GGF79226.1 NADH dehydrogenase subunit E [Rhizobium wenxiniae]
MSVRRLAEEQFQPASFAFNAENAAWAEATIRKYPEGRQQSAVIPLLMRAQEQEGWVTRATIEHVAARLDMPYIRVMEVATFYTQFQLKPIGTRAHIQVCGTTPCMLRGAEELIKVCQHKIHHDPLQPNADGTLSWEEVECQGACVNAPMVIIFKDAYEDLTPERLEEIIDAFEAGKGDEIKPGPQIDRHLSAPEGGAVTLNDEIKPVRTNLEPQPESHADAAPVPPAEAAKPKDTAPETDPKLKTPVTAPKAAENNVKAAEAQAESGTAKAEPVKAAPATKSEKPSLEDKNRPKGIEKPAEVDDLKLISGVGPKIEATLHELGIFTFAQVASWKKAEREWVDGYLNFKGRIERDDWLNQAKALAKGGEAEYIKVFGKKPR